jgi:WD40 repeat protein
MRTLRPQSLVSLGVVALLIGSGAALLLSRRSATPDGLPTVARPGASESVSPASDATKETARAGETDFERTPFVVSRLGSATWLAPFGVRAIRFLRDGSGFAMACDTRVRVYPLPAGRPITQFDAAAGQERESEPPDPWDARAQGRGFQFRLAVAESGRTLVSAAGNHVKAVEMSSHALRGEIEFHGEVAYIGAPDDDDRVLIRADGGLREWRIGSATTTQLAVCGAVLAASQWTGLLVAEVPDRTGSGASIALLDSRGRALTTLADPPRGPWAVGFSPDESLIAWLSDENRFAHELRVARVTAADKPRTFKTPAADVHRLRWRDAHTVLLGRKDGATAFDVETGEPKGDCADWDYAAAFSFDGRLRARIVRDAILVEDVATGERAVPDPGPRAAGNVAFRPGREEFACADADGAVDLVDARSGRVVRRLDGPGDYVWSLVFDASGTRLLVNRNGSSIDVLDVEGREPARRHARHGCYVAFAGGRAFALTGKHDGPWRRISLDDGSEAPLPEAAADLEAWALGVSTDGAVALGFSAQDELLAWDLDRVAIVARYAVAGGRVYASDGGRRVVVLNDRLLAFDAARPAAAPLDLGPAPKSATPNPDCTISPDGKWFAARDGDVVAVWDLATGRRRAALRGFTDTYRLDLSFSHDGRLLAAGPQVSGVACVWDVDAATR